jgi:L-ascorbate metabolism protein UlaG (beta-lactamase superfamily)
MSSDLKIAEFTSFQLAKGQVALWWLGQASFALRAADTTLLLDPFLSDYPGRLVSAPFKPEEATGIDLIVITHDHPDHLDRPSLPGLAAASRESVFIVPEPVAAALGEVGISTTRILQAQPGRPIVHRGITVHPVAAKHGMHLADAYTFGEESSLGQFRYLGYVIEAGGPHVYLAGDTVVYDGLDSRLQELSVDLALIPINGRDYYREAQDVVGNMNPHEAAELASRVGVDLLIPTHWDMFEPNLGFPEHLLQIVSRRHPELSVLVPSRLRAFVYSRPQSAARLS